MVDSIERARGFVGNNPARTSLKVVPYCSRNHSCTSEHSSDVHLRTWLGLPHSAIAVLVDASVARSCGRLLCGGNFLARLYFI
jgi:hypothetical protein